MYERFGINVAPRAHTIEGLVDGSYLCICREKVMADSPGKNLNLMRDIELPNNMLKQPVQTKPDLFKDEPRVAGLSGIHTSRVMEPNDPISWIVS